MIDHRLKNVIPKDLLFVILYGMFLPLILGILLGFLDYYVISGLGISFGSLLYWLLAIATGTMVRKQYEDPHLLYVILTGIGMVFGAAVIQSMPFLWTLQPFTGLSDILIYLGYFLGSFITLVNPLDWILGFSLASMIDLLFIAVGTYLGLKRTL
jgi:hypothetical protein